MQNRYNGKDEPSHEILSRVIINKAHRVLHEAQELQDLLDLLLEKCPDAVVHDKFTIVDQQMRIVHMDARALTQKMSDFLELAGRLIERQVKKDEE